MHKWMKCMSLPKTRLRVIFFLNIIQENFSVYSRVLTSKIHHNQITHPNVLKFGGNHNNLSRFIPDFSQIFTSILTKSKPLSNSENLPRKCSFSAAQSVFENPLKIEYSILFDDSSTKTSPT